MLLAIASDKFRLEFAESVLELVKLGKYKLYGTPGTAEYYKEHCNVDIAVVSKPDSESDDGPGTALHEIKAVRLHLVVNISDETI